MLRAERITADDRAMTELLDRLAIDLDDTPPPPRRHSPSLMPQAAAALCSPVGIVPTSTVAARGCVGTPPTTRPRRHACSHGDGPGGGE